MSLGEELCDGDPALTEVQLWMTELIQRRSSLPNDQAIAREAELHIGKNPRLSPVEQLEIYREQFWLRHTGSLIEDFPALSTILGQQEWNRLVEGYLSATPIQSFTLRDLGENLPAFIQSFADLKHPKLCLDMARLEWAYVELFDAEDPTPLDPARLANLSAEEWLTARLVLSPALRLLEVSYPVASLRRRIRIDEEWLPLPAPEPQYLVLYRGLDRVLRFEPVSLGAFTLLSLLQLGESAVAAAEGANQAAPDEAIFEQLGSWVAQWGRIGWIVNVTKADDAR